MSGRWDRFIDAMNHIRASGREWPRIEGQLVSGLPIAMILSRDGKCALLCSPQRGGATYAYLRWGDASKGSWTKSAADLKDPDRKALWAFALLLAADPLKALGDMGKHLGFCIMCSRPLSNDESVALGIGPDCRKRLGL